jgi:hypothetical protein
MQFPGTQELVTCTADMGDLDEAAATYDAAPLPAALGPLAAKLDIESIACLKASLDPAAPLPCSAAAGDVWLGSPGGSMWLIWRADGVSPCDTSSYTLSALAPGVSNSHVFGDLSQRPRASTPLSVLRGGSRDIVIACVPARNWHFVRVLGLVCT